MSVELMSRVWKSALPRPEKYVLLAYADHANDDGEGVYPSIGYVAWKTDYEERQVQRITASLVQKQIMVHQGFSQWGTNVYKINVNQIPVKPKFQPKTIDVNTSSPVIMGGDKMSPPMGGGDILSKESEGGGDILSKKRAKMSPKSSYMNINKNMSSRDEHPAPSTEQTEQDFFDALGKEGDQGQGVKVIVPLNTKGKKRDPLLSHPAVKAFRSETRYHMPIAWRPEVVAAVGEVRHKVDQWRAVVHEWLGRGYNPSNVQGMLDVFKRGGFSENDRVRSPEAVVAALPPVFHAETIVK
jgi:hypothetical protein